MVESAEDRGLFAHGVGEQLAAERMRQRLELSEVAARTRIPLRHLEAIETGQCAALPALPYSAGFVKSYGNMLGLDGQALSRAFRDQVGEERHSNFAPEAYEPVDPSRVPSRLLAMIALGVALLLGVGYLLLRFESDNSDLAKLAADTAQDVRPVVPAKVAPPAVAAGPVVPTGPISVTAVEDVWVKISERETGRNYFMSILTSGQSFTVPDDAVDPILRTGRPQSLKILIGSTELPPVGEPDRLVRDYSLKRDALVAIATASPEAPMSPDDDASNIADGQAESSFKPLPPPSQRQLRGTRQRPAEADPVESRPDSAEPISDSNQRP